MPLQPTPSATIPPGGGHSTPCWGPTVCVCVVSVVRISNCQSA